MASPLGPGILSGPIDGPWRHGRSYREVEARIGLRVTHLGSMFTGEIAGFEHDGPVRLRSAITGLERVFRLTRGGFGLGGEHVTLFRAAPASGLAAGPRTTASGSRAVGPARARVARASRIWVEGVHDAELVEKVWGDDLRVEGVVVERLDGIDRLAEMIQRFGPVPDARLGILVDHLVPGSKESRIAVELVGPCVMISGTPYVDVWQAIGPGVVGLPAWPEVPRGRPWKEGICEVLGAPSPARLWRRMLGSVKSYADLEPGLVGPMEALIDFVTVG